MPTSPFEDIPPGAVISGIERLPSDPNVCRVRVDGRVIARLRAIDVEALDLSAGQAWTDALARTLEATLAMNKARRTAFNVLGRRAYSRGELVERLVRKGHDRTAARLVADEMVADGWLDDAEYARAVARGVLAQKPAAHRLLVQKLLARRIDRELAEQITHEILEDVDLAGSALELARRRLRTMTGVSDATARRRLGAMLARRGFDADIVLGVLDDLELGFDNDAANQ